MAQAGSDCQKLLPRAENLIRNFFLKFERLFLDGICSTLDLFILLPENARKLTKF